MIQERDNNQIRLLRVIQERRYEKIRSQNEKIRNLEDENRLIRESQERRDEEIRSQERQDEEICEEEMRERRVRRRAHRRIPLENPVREPCVSLEYPDM